MATKKPAKPATMAQHMAHPLVVREVIGLNLGLTLRIDIFLKPGTRDLKG